MLDYYYFENERANGCSVYHAKRSFTDDADPNFQKIDRPRRSEHGPSEGISVLPSPRPWVRDW